MSHPPPLFLRLNHEIRGPFDPERLRELAESGVITPATEASPGGTGPWTPIGDAGDYAGVFPPRVRYEFKARPFEEVNQPAVPPVDLRAMIAAANQDGRAPSADAPPVPPPLNDVERILRLNRERERQAGLDQLKPLPPAPNRRRRDYWLILIGGNLVLLVALNAIGALVLGGVVAGVFTVGLTGVMYGVMDRY